MHQADHKQQGKKAPRTGRKSKGSTEPNLRTHFPKRDQVGQQKVQVWGVQSSQLAKQESPKKETRSSKNI